VQQYGICQLQRLKKYTHQLYLTIYSLKWCYESLPVMKYKTGQNNFVCKVLSLMRKNIYKITYLMEIGSRLTFE